MASRELGQIQTFKAARDLSSYQYCPVYISAANTVDYSGAAGTVRVAFGRYCARQTRAGGSLQSEIRGCIDPEN